MKTMNSMPHTQCKACYTARLQRWHPHVNAREVASEEAREGLMHMNEVIYDFDDAAPNPYNFHVCETSARPTHPTTLA